MSFNYFINIVKCKKIVFIVNNKYQKLMFLIKNTSPQDILRRKINKIHIHEIEIL